MKGGVCSSLYNGAFVPGQGENAATESALVCQPAAALERAPPPTATVAPVYRAAVRQQVLRYLSEPAAARTVLMFGRRQDSDWTRPRRILSPLGNGTS